MTPLLRSRKHLNIIDHSISTYAHSCTFSHSRHIRVQLTLIRNVNHSYFEYRSLTTCSFTYHWFRKRIDDPMNMADHSISTCTRKSSFLHSARVGRWVLLYPSQYKQAVYHQSITSVRCPQDPCAIQSMSFSIFWKRVLVVQLVMSPWQAWIPLLCRLYSPRSSSVHWRRFYSMNLSGKSSRSDIFLQVKCIVQFYLMSSVNENLKSLKLRYGDMAR